MLTSITSTSGLTSMNPTKQPTGVRLKMSEVIFAVTDSYVWPGPKIGNS